MTVHIAPSPTPRRTARTNGQRRRVVLIAHGSPDPRHRRGIGRLADRLQGLLACEVTAAFLEHDTPSAVEALRQVAATGSATEHTMVAPLLFTAGYHWRTDIPALVAHAGSRVTLVAPPHPAQFAGVVADLVHPHADDVVIASAGSERPEIVPRFAELADTLRTSYGVRRVSVALSAAAVAEISRPNSVVVPFLSADGVFADRIRANASSRGARTTSVVGEATAFADSLSAALR